MRYRYKIIEHKEMTIILRDDGYRIYFKVLEVNPAFEYKPDITKEDWELWAEYKQCDLPRVGYIIAASLMGYQTNELES